MTRLTGAYLLTFRKGVSDSITAHSIHFEETYENLRLVVEKIKYHTHNWYLCGHIKILGMLIGQERGHTKFPYFLCEWPKREDLIPESKNVVNASLVDNQKILLPPCT